MRKILTLALILGTAITIGSVAGADEHIRVEEATAAGVDYDLVGTSAMIRIAGEPGTPYAVFDATGTRVAAGALDEGGTSFVTTGHTGMGPDGSIVFVVVDGIVVASTDPFWEWD